MVLKYLEKGGIYDGFNSSHAYSVALDSVYGAYLKAKYPLEYYSTVLKIYQNDTKTTSKIMKELKYFNIDVLPIEYGKSKGDYAANKEANAIYKGIGSIKFLNNDVGYQLYDLSQNNVFHTFSEILFEIHQNSIADMRQIKILTTLNFFHSFGGNKKLLDVIEKYESRLKNKGLKEETKLTRLDEVKEFERTLKSESLNIKDQVKAEIDYYGYEVTTIEKSPESIYMVTNIDSKYTPKIRLYKLKTGDVIQMKCKKADMKKNMFGDYSIIQIKKIEEKRKRKLVDGEWIASDETEQYLSEWEVLR